MSTLDYLMDTLAHVKARAESAASYRWATITSIRPLRLLFDGEQTPVLREPVNLVGPLEAGQRVWVITVLRRSTIVGRAGGSGLPTGALLPYAGATPPQGFLLCDGATYAKSLYPALAAVLGATGAGASFQVPDMRGRVPVGVSAAEPVVASLGKSGGEFRHALTVEEMPSHDHDLKGNTFSWGSSGNVNVYGAVVQSGSSSGNRLFTFQDADGWGDTLATGGGKAHSIMQPFRTVNYIIKI